MEQPYDFADDPRLAELEPAFNHSFRVFGNETWGYVIGLSSWSSDEHGEMCLGWSCKSYAELEELVEMLTDRLNNLLEQVQNSQESRLLRRGFRPSRRPAHIERHTGLSRRFAIFRRDNYRCQICGRTAKDGVRLEIDHKVPRAKGGSNHPSNLWTLCFDCNRGKSDYDL